MTSPLLSVSRRALVNLAQALANGAVRPPFTIEEVSTYVAPPDAEAVLAEIERLHGLGMQPSALAEAIALIGEARRDVERAHDEVALVWSGPEAGNARSRETSVVVTGLFEAAKREVLVATYALHECRKARIFDTLAARMTAIPDLRVRFFVHIGRRERDRRADAEVLREYAKCFRDEHWPAGARLPEVFYDPRTLAVGATRASLHAKCVAVDDERAFVTSANFTEAAQQRNVEVGVEVKNVNFARSLREQFDALIARRLLPRVPM